ncbi:hypothetical protein [Streptomyces sp. NPDC002104]
MSVHLRGIASELAGVLWREHTVYRDREGGVVIRGEHVRRWISLAPAGGPGEVRVRVGRILEGGTTAPARAEAVASLSAGPAELATVCRRLLAEASVDATTAPPPGRGRRTPRRGRHTGSSSWLVVLAVAGAIVGIYLARASGTL